jgi:carboxyl-terminal processing protease
MFKTILLTIISLSIALTLPLGTSAQTTIAQVEITKGDFLQEAVSALGVTRITDEKNITWARIPDKYKTAVTIANQRGALRSIRPLNLGAPLTRQQAIETLMLLKNIDYSQLQYSELGTLKRSNVAILIALYDKWLEPISEDSFGGELNLTIDEAYSLINNAFKSDTIQYASNLPGLEILTETWNLLEQTYVHPEDIDPQEVAYAAAKAIVESATKGDRYSVFFEPVEADEFENQLNNEFIGIGAEVTLRDGKVTIVAPLKNSPAEKAGVLAGDIVLKVNETDIEGMSLFESVQLIRGPKDSTVTLTVLRNGKQRTIDITRDLIIYSDVAHEMKGRKAILELRRFSNNAEQDARAALEELLENNPNELIIDLRNNPGGFLHAANEVLALILPKGTTTLHVITRSESYENKTLTEPIVPSNLPITVLINGGSASAAEIMAGALQDHGRATLMGEQSFGKGSVQSLNPLSDGSQVKITIARWETPDNRYITAENRLQPDVAVAANPDTTRDEILDKALRH